MCGKFLKNTCARLAKLGLEVDLSLSLTHCTHLGSHSQVYDLIYASKLKLADLGQFLTNYLSSVWFLDVAMFSVSAPLHCAGGKILLLRQVRDVCD